MEIFGLSGSFALPLAEKVAGFVPLDPGCPAWSRVVPRSIFFGTRRDTQLRSVDFGLRSGRQQEEARIARILGKRGAFEFGVRNAESGGCDMIMHDNGG